MCFRFGGSASGTTDAASSDAAPRVRVRDAAREDAPRAFPNGDASEARLAVAATTATTRGFDFGWTPAIAGLRERIARRR
jgi:hypothetical protein